MGHRKYSAPRRGSLAYLPRGRASHWTPRIRYWPNYEGAPRLLGFAGFKAGTTHVTVVDNRQGSLNYGKEVTFPVTVVETPPLKVAALRFYEMRDKGLRTIGEVWSNDQDKELQRIIKTPEKFDDTKGWEKIDTAKEKLVEIRAVVASRPRSTTIGRKTPDLFEVKIDGGTAQDQLEFGKRILGKDVKISEVFKEGGEVDVISITKGKGIQGPVKRWGIKKLKHKSRKTVRGVGSIGPWHPHCNVFCPPSGTNGIRPENRIQQADSQTGRQRDRRNPQRRISTIWTNQNGIRGYSRDYSGACQKARGTEVSVQGISCWRSSQARTIGPLVETRSLVNLVRRTDPDGSSLES